MKFIRRPDPDDSLDNSRTMIERVNTRLKGKFGGTFARRIELRRGGFDQNAPAPRSELFSPGLRVGFVMAGGMLCLSARHRH
jgi:hypothetical protein